MMELLFIKWDELWSNYDLLKNCVKMGGWIFSHSGQFLTFRVSEFSSTLASCFEKTTLKHFVNLVYLCVSCYVVAIFSAISKSINYKVSWLCLSEPMASSQLQISAWWSNFSEVSRCWYVFIPLSLCSVQSMLNFHYLFVICTWKFKWSRIYVQCVYKNVMHCSVLNRWEATIFIIGDGFKQNLSI